MREPFAFIIGISDQNFALNMYPVFSQRQCVMELSHFIKGITDQLLLVEIQLTQGTVFMNMETFT